ncbi:MAG: undecaprenyl-diphosphate phosphatase [Alicyclobacillaceae bacterium]|nr:undecaprenyl-diphosphate phosphatase [Alicyclobacillaceae bacterium]
MDLAHAALLGFVQGLTEFLPISSSGHLILFHRWMGVQEGSLTFDIWLHVGTLAAVLAAYRRDVADMVLRPWAPEVRWVVVGTIPTALIGYWLHDPVEALFEGGHTLAVEFLVTGIVLYLAELAPRGAKRVGDMRWTDAFWIGILQGLAVLPALSRSGMTVAGALWRGLERREAARYSFLLSVPAIAGAALQEWLRLDTGGAGESWLVVAAGGAAAAASGYAAIFWMIRALSARSLKPFAWYVWGLAAVILGLQLAGKW